MLKENQDQNGALASINNNSTAKAPVNTTNTWRFARRCDTTDDYRQPK
jgi:hypothetical protein